MKGLNGKPLVDEMFQALSEQRRFNMKADTHGYPRLGWLIGHYLLKDFNEHDRNWKLYHEGYGDTVHQNIWNMIERFKEKNIKVYRNKTGRKLTLITLEEDDPDVIEADFLRIVEHDEQVHRASISEIQFKHAAKLQEFENRRTKLLPQSREQATGPVYTN